MNESAKPTTIIVTAKDWLMTLARRIAPEMIRRRDRDSYFRAKAKAGKLILYTKSGQACSYLDVPDDEQKFYRPISPYMPDRPIAYYDSRDNPSIELPPS